MRGPVLAILLAAALGLFAPGAAADPDEVDPDLAKRDDDYAAGRAAVERKEWAKAIEALRKAERRHPEHADLQNFLGYSHRNLRQFDLAFKHYKRAIELDPRHRGAHEYIGETYLLVGDLASAEKHLEALRRICMLGCEQLTDLEQAVARHKAGATSDTGRVY